MGEHRLFVGAQLHVPGYVQAVDPGFVGPNKLWVDTSGGTGNWVLKMRNDADNGWEALTVVAVIVSATTIALWNADANGGLGGYQEWGCRNNGNGDPELYAV